ncbi:MAG: DNA cytosine methyltransferase [Cytophagales bacterium]|nr:DNA cytosine methyltransferase [Cytophagales bacterium]
MVIYAIDLFCGVGGLTQGLREAGISVVAGIDIDPSCAHPFEANHPQSRFLLKSVESLSAADLHALWPSNSIRLLAGCAPCQPFSSYARNAPKDHSKWGMLFHFSRLIRDTKPEFVTMENVPGLAREAPFVDFLNTLKEGGYQVAYQTVNVADFGVPQQRKRLVLIASKLGQISLPSPTHSGSKNWLSVKDAIGKLPVLDAGEIDKNDLLHRSARLSPLNSSRIRASKPGGTWRDWPKELVAECHRKESGKHSAGVYGRMRWDQPAPTMTTLCCGFGNGRFGHPEQNRAISLREAAIFQSFPINYQFASANNLISIKRVSKLIGNAVPPKLGEAVGITLIKHFSDISSQTSTTQSKVTHRLGKSKQPL